MLPTHETDLHAFDARHGGAFAEFLRSAWCADQDEWQLGELGSHPRG